MKAYKGLGMHGPVAKWYASITANNLDRFKELAQRVSRQIPEGASVLELAPGPGYFAIELAKLGNYRITGIDISETFVDIARANASKEGVRVEFCHGNASDLPFAHERFDFIVCCAAFKNFTQPLEAIKEMHRVLKRGGQALIIDLRRDTPPSTLDEAIHEMRLNPLNSAITKLTFRFMLLKRAYTKSAVERMASESPFQRAEVAEDGISLDIRLTK